MNENEGSKTIRPIKDAWISPSELANALIIMAIIIILTLATVQTVRNKFKDDVERSLTNVLEITKRDFIHEEEKLIDTINTHAQSKEIIQLVEQLLPQQTTQPTTYQSNNLTQIQQNALFHLRYYFHLVQTEGKYLDFSIIAPGNITVASTGDKNLGEKHSLTSQPDLLAKMWSGQPTLTRVQNGGMALKDAHGHDIKHSVTMFAGAPVYNENNQVIALLALRISPYTDLFPLLEEKQFGDSGETYAFDKHGLMLSHSRFEEDIKKQNMNRHAIHLYDPGAVVIGSSKTTEGNTKPVLTKMAASATKGESGHDFDGYRDYRGINVVGVWHWFSDINIGIATEQDLSDAYSTFYFTRNLTLLVGAIGCMLTFLYFTVSSIRQRYIVSSEAYLNAIYKSSRDALIIIDKYGIIQRLNPTTEKMFGYTSAELIGENISLLMPEPYRSAHDSYLEHYRQFEHTPSKRPPVINFTREVSGMKSNDVVFPVELTVTQLNLIDGRYLAGCIRDISDRVDAETYLNAIYQTSVDALIIIDKQGIIQKCNSTTEELFGYDHDELIGKNVRILMPPSYRHEHETALKKYHSPGLEKKEEDKEEESTAVVRDFQGLKADGTSFPIELNVNPLELPEGTFFAGSIRDISERKRAEAQARENALHLTNTLRHAHVGTWDWSRKNHSMSYTGSTAYIYGLEPEATTEIRTRQSADFIQCVHPDDQEMVKNAVNSSDQSDNQFDIEYRVIWPDGNIHWINARGDVVFDEQGTPTNTIGILQDITRRKKLEQELRDSEQALRESKNHLSNILDTAPANIYIKNLDGKYIFVNPAWKKSLSLSSQEVFGRDDFELFSEEIAKSHENYQQLVLETEQPVQLEEEFINTDGNYTAFMTSLFPLKDSEGKIYALGGWSTVITEMKEVHKELEAARLEADASNEAKSYFLASMSHEIRTPMNGVVGIIDVLRYTSLDDQQQQLVTTINDSALSLLSIIDDILDFSKVDAGKTVLEEIPISLEQVVDGVGETLLPLAAKKGIELITFCEPNLPKFYGDAVRIRQILYNVGGNAIKFTGNDRTHNGRVIIRCEQTNIISEGGGVRLRLSIEDNGIGISPEIKQDLFNPFSQAESSTTRKYGGTGLGLAISKSLCELMEGDIEVESQQGEGAKFIISIVLKPAEESADTTTSANLLQGKHITLIKSENPDDIGNEILASYLNSAGVQLSETTPDNLSRMENNGQTVDQIIDETIDETKVPAAHIIVIDTMGMANEINPIKEACKRRYSDATDLHFVVISRGMRRQARMQGDDTLQLDLNCLSKHTFLNTVASAAGLISPDIASPWDSKDHLVQYELPSIPTKESSNLLLIAEDNPINQRVITHQLSLLGLTAEVANDGQEALGMWEKDKEKYCLLLTDCHMPNMDGYALAGAIRQQENDGERLPIIALTADAMAGAKATCLNAGMDDYLTKPLQIETLSTKLTEWLPNLETLQQEPQVERIVESTAVIDSSINSSTDSVAEVAEVEVAEVIDAVDASKLPEMLGSDEPELLSECYHEFLLTAVPTVATLCEAITTQDHKVVVTQAHSLKSSAYTVGATALADCCQLLEASGKNGEQHVMDENVTALKLYMEQAHDWIMKKYPLH